MNIVFDFVVIFSLLAMLLVFECILKSKEEWGSEAIMLRFQLAYHLSLVNLFKKTLIISIIANSNFHLKASRFLKGFN